jgi:hypothetical protein
MTLFLRLVFFSVTIAIGIGTNSISNVHSLFHHKYSRFSGINPSERFFTLSEGQEKLRRRVHSANPNSYPGNSGLVVYLDWIEDDKFFVVIYWDFPPDEEQPGLRWYSRDNYEKLIIED